MKALVHLFGSAYPLRNGESVAANCGKVVDRVHKLFAWDDLTVNTDFKPPSLSGNCPDCWGPTKGKKGKQYAFAIVEEREYRRMLDSAKSEIRGGEISHEPAEDNFGSVDEGE